MISFALLFVSGVWLLQQQAALPDMHLAGWLATALPALWMPRRERWQRITRTVLFLVAALAGGFFYAAGMAQQRLADELPAAWQGRDIALSGVVAEMPRLHGRGLSFMLDVESVVTPGAHVPRHILLSTYRDEKSAPLELHAGERWQLTVRLKQPHGTSNPYNFDFEAWALERNLRAVGYVYNKGDNRRIDARVSTPGYLIERLREAVRTQFNNTLADAPYAGVLSALAIGDQGSISPAHWQIFTRTGVNHLMSISGLHITMLAGFAFVLVYGLWRRSTRLTLHLPARKAAALTGFAVALGYALLAGYGVPAQRTVYMLATVAIALWSSRNIAPAQLLAVALTVVLLLDPWAVLAPGFWLSFGAVALIFFITANRLGTGHWVQKGDGVVAGAQVASPLRALIEYGRVQWAMSIGLIPLLLAMFQQVSLVSPLANAFAIPLVSFIVVPLTLLGALLPFDWLLQLAHRAMSLCMIALEWLNALPAAVWAQHAPPAWSIGVGMCGVFWLLLPRGFPARWLGGLMLLPMFAIAPEAPPNGTLRLYIFDVGQGLAVAAQTQDHVLLYDTGPDYNGEADSGNRILVPALRGLGIAQLDGLVITHDDIDHTGGAASVLQAIPTAWVSSPLPADHELLRPVRDSRRCAAGQSWEWDGVRFEMLHPSLSSYAQADIRDNERGCVLRISTGAHSVLLATDIERGTEQHLLEKYADKLSATLLIVPHHGSKTSSTMPFIKAVNPRYAVFTVGYRNRFHHPHPEVVARYRDAGIELLRSDEDGAILIEMDAKEFSVEPYRKSHARYWQQSGKAN
ncbi:MAG: DNA internalization-related competence protein ComEC/Rec2 [Gallionellaceae bacterium]|nr:MAG: DNA internalization-related competence protein ComEC/Rec2 [Gallionellaceae bacterium]